MRIALRLLCMVLTLAVILPSVSAWAAVPHAGEDPVRHTSPDSDPAASAVAVDPCTDPSHPADAGGHCCPGVCPSPITEALPFTLPAHGPAVQSRLPAMLARGIAERLERPPARS